MSAFYIGQRVRLVAARTASGHQHLGWIATVAQSSPVIKGWSFDCTAKTLEVVTDDLVIRYDNGEEGTVKAWQVEPIIPPGLESLEEINELWQTEPETVRA